MESKAKKLVKSEARDFCTYNKRQISRIYPSGIRADSRSRSVYEILWAGFILGQTSRVLSDFWGCGALLVSHLLAYLSRRHSGSNQTTDNMNDVCAC